ncbi:hypothetical protein ACLEQD_45445, partial [Corallococcus sp. 4LFB]
TDRLYELGAELVEKVRVAGRAVPRYANELKAARDARRAVLPATSRSVPRAVPARGLAALEAHRAAGDRLVLL